MGLFDFLRRKEKDRQAVEEKPPVAVHPVFEPAGPPKKDIDFTLPASAEETELVSAITASILAGDQPESSFRVKQVTAIDTEKEMAAAIAAAIAAGEYPDSTFKLKRIERIN